jgi:hypothetical protein
LGYRKSTKHVHCFSAQSGHVGSSLGARPNRIIALYALAATTAFDPIIGLFSVTPCDPEASVAIEAFRRVIRTCSSAQKSNRNAKNQRRNASTAAGNNHSFSVSRHTWESA